MKHTPLGTERSRTKNERIRQREFIGYPSLSFMPGHVPEENIHSVPCYLTPADSNESETVPFSSITLLLTKLT